MPVDYMQLCRLHAALHSQSGARRRFDLGHFLASELNLARELNAIAT